MNDIKKILRQQMRAVGMTPEQLARVSGVGVVTVYRTLSGGNPTLRVLDSMLSAVGLRILALPDSPSGLPTSDGSRLAPQVRDRPGGAHLHRRRLFCLRSAGWVVRRSPPAVPRHSGRNGHGPESARKFAHNRREKLTGANTRFRAMPLHKKAVPPPFFLPILLLHYIVLLVAAVAC